MKLFIKTLFFGLQSKLKEKKNINNSSIYALPLKHQKYATMLYNARVKQQAFRKSHHTKSHQSKK